MIAHLRAVAATVFCSIALLTASAQQTESALGARDIFWSADGLVDGVAPNPGTKQVAALDTAPKMKNPPAPMPPHHRSAKTSKTRQIDPNLVESNGYGAQPHLVRASLNRLGLRYTILEQEAGGQYSEVLPTSAFHNKDRVKLSVMANATGYLYLIQQGSSGTWSSVFPAPDAPRESNHVEAGRVYLVPTDGTTFEFTGPPGTEKLFLVLSRERVDDLDHMIFGLGQSGNATTGKAAAGKSAQGKTGPGKAAPENTELEPTAAESGPMQEASNTVTDALVQRMQGRDLTPVKEEVTSAAGTPKSSQESAIYVVSASASSAGDARLVAGFTLDHQ